MSGLYSKEEYIARTKGGHGACPGCGLALSLRLFTKAMGEDMIMVIPPGCTPVTVMSPQFNAAFSVFVALFGSTAVFASGLKTALTIRGETDTAVVGWGGDGATFDIGLQVLSGAAERNDDIIYVCCDNEAYQNTGNQRSSATPRGGTTSTNPSQAPKAERKKDIMQIMAGHHIPYAATATVGFPDDLIKKIKKAKETIGFKFIHILAPCPTGWSFRSERSVEVSRLAVETNIFPLFEVEHGTRFIINREPSGVPVEEYLKIQSRYKHLASGQIDALQEEVDEKWNRLKWLTTYQNNKQ
jgi:pyruvate ferredoxin oxidoreductase beta subunit/2-oxoisovalerate ferredoxin oxidoreductase beta subunit